ncbi:MAG: NAD(P)-dependent alcohol dehydrogenase [Candidatus Sulfotelmatobacter sp.]
MKAIVYHNYGSPDVLKYEDIAKPVPKDNEVLIKVRATSLNPLDWHFMRGVPYIVRIIAGLRKPKFIGIGADVAGQVEAVGKTVTQFKPGDDVFGGCRGAFAEYACASESELVAKPDNITFEQASTARIAGLTALQGLRKKGHLQSGQKALINGASGGVGTFAVQIAKSFGAEVTGVCSTRNLEMVRSIGADRVIDYTKMDFAQDSTNGEQSYDIILDLVGNHSLSAYRRVLNPKGTLVMAGGPSGRWKVGLARGLRARVLSMFGSRKFVGMMARTTKEDLTTLQELLKAKKIAPVIDRQYSLSEVPEAIRYLEEGHARGKIVITLQ